VSEAVSEEEAVENLHGRGSVFCEKDSFSGVLFSRPRGVPRIPKIIFSELCLSYFRNSGNVGRLPWVVGAGPWLRLDIVGCLISWTGGEGSFWERPPGAWTGRGPCSWNRGFVRDGGQVRFRDRPEARGVDDPETVQNPQKQVICRSDRFHRLSCDL
jgi:hypothetical protein